jgi:alkylated DNA repair protein (DNA oxidative demethylase)
MSVGMTNCGEVGWLSGPDGYCYSEFEPETGQRWPEMPDALRDTAAAAASEAGFDGFLPDACLVNLYGPNSRMGLHQDRDEPDLSHPIVSISLGRSARFRFGATKRAAPTRSVVLDHGDILVFGGKARLMYHGIDRLVGASHPLLGDLRINLTFRCVGRVSARTGLSA